MIILHYVLHCIYRFLTCKRCTTNYLKCVPYHDIRSIACENFPSYYVLVFVIGLDMSTSESLVRFSG